MHIIRISSAAIMEKDIMGKGITEDIAGKINTDVMETAAAIEQQRDTLSSKIA